MRSGFMVLLAVTGLAFAPRIFAQCAGAAQGLAPAKEYALHHGGQESAYLVPLEGRAADLRLGTPQRLPQRHVAPCGFWLRLTGRCIVSRARFRSALSAVVVAGWDRNGQCGAIAYRGLEPPVRLLSPRGVPPGYLWDTDNGRAIVRTASGDAFAATPTGMSRCGDYPALAPRPGTAR